VNVQDYFKALTIGAAVSLAAQAEGPTRFLAGGTDLLMQLEREPELVSRTPDPSPPGIGEELGQADSLPDGVTLIDLADVPEMAQIEWSDSGLTIGASVKLADLLSPELAAAGYGLLAQGAAEVGSPQIRHLATLGGNVCNASPSADTAAPLLALEAEALLVSAEGERSLPLRQFWLGPGKTALRPGELNISRPYSSSWPLLAWPWFTAWSRRPLKPEMSPATTLWSNTWPRQAACLSRIFLKPRPIKFIGVTKATSRPCIMPWLRP
jgi:hypothetical protein